MYDAEQDDTAAFEGRLDAVCKEIGDRGKLMVPEAVPLREPTPAPGATEAEAPASVPAPPAARVETEPAPVPERTSAPAPTPTLASVPTPGLVAASSSTPALHRNPSTVGLERDELLRQVQHMTSQLASIETSTAAPVHQQHGNLPSPQLSEAYFLERERDRAATAAAERQVERERLERAERQAERERLERAERERFERVERERERDRADCRN